MHLPRRTLQGQKPSAGLFIGSFFCLCLSLSLPLLLLLLPASAPDASRDGVLLGGQAGAAGRPAAPALREGASPPAPFPVLPLPTPSCQDRPSDTVLPAASLLAGRLPLRVCSRESNLGRSGGLRQGGRQLNYIYIIFPQRGLTRCPPSPARR